MRAIPSEMSGTWGLRARPRVRRVIGGGERATSLDFLTTQIAAHELPQEAFEWYLDLRRYGQRAHAGFGRGSSVCRMDVCIEHREGDDSIPRMMHRLRP